MTSPTAPQRELTVKSIALGIFLAFVFGAANAYLGMKAGQTVAATIPAAVIAMALFRIPAFRGGLLEQNAQQFDGLYNSVECRETWPMVDRAARRKA